MSINTGYLLLIPLLAVATGKVLLQTRITKEYLRNTGDVVFYNIFMFAIIAVVYLFINGGRRPSEATVRISLLYGLSAVMFQCMQTAALSSGPVSLTVLISGFGSMFPVLYGVMFLGEKMQVQNVIGLGLAILSLVLSSDVLSAGSKKINVRWVVSAFLAMTANGAVNIFSKVQKMNAPREDTQMILIAYSAGAVLLALIFILFFRKKKLSFVPDGRFFLSAAYVSAAMTLYLPLMLIVVGKLPLSSVAPVMNIGTSITTMLLGMLIFRDSLSKSQKLSIAVGVPAIVLMSLTI